MMLAPIDIIEIFIIIFKK